MLFVLENDPIVPAGYLGDVLTERKSPAATIQLHAGAMLPAPEDATAVAVLGGTMGAYDGADYPYLEAEKAFLAEVVDRGVATLGICLGCQLLADALGGRAFKAPAVECRFGVLDLTPAGVNDPVVGRLGGKPVLSWHQDTWDLPPGGGLLATSPHYPQAFRMGSAVAIQPHPEAPPDLVARWARNETGAAMLHSAGVEPAELIEVLTVQRHAGESAARALFNAWLDEAGF